MKKHLLLSTALCFSAILSFSGKSLAQQEMGSLPYYSLSSSEYNEHSHDWAVFLEYNLHREQCQHYQDPPPGYIYRGCDVYRIGTPAVAVIEPQAGDTGGVTEEKHYLFPTSIYFDFDRSNIRHSEIDKLNSVIHEIQKDNPPHVIVAGHTDRAGSSGYNMGLSQRRAQAVTDEMISHGVNKDIIEQKAYGETDLAVPTADGVPLQENRRTVIDVSPQP